MKKYFILFCFLPFLVNGKDIEQFEIRRLDDSKLFYYFSAPNNDTYPIGVLVVGSSSEESIDSIENFHRYFLDDFMKLNLGILTLEERGVSGEGIDKKEFFEYYTRSYRLDDHRLVIDAMKKNPPNGWNGKFILIGASEGGLIVTSLTEEVPEDLLATITWSGASDWPWREEILHFVNDLKQKNILNADERKSLPKTREGYEQMMDATLEDPTYEKFYLGMSYQYHADAISYPDVNYDKLKTPFLVVIGGLDSIAPSADIFLEKAKKQGHLLLTLESIIWIIIFVKDLM